MRFIRLGILALGLIGPAAAHELEGVWIFEKEVDTRADGTLAPLPLPRYEGILIYTADGYVSATLMPRARTWTLDSATRADLLASVGEGAATAYAGRYVVDARKRTVTHSPLTSVDPGDVGRQLVRNYRVQGNVLLLSGAFEHDGEQLTFTVHWRRAPAPVPGDR